jgi:hypothetical protein
VYNAPVSKILNLNPIDAILSRVKITRGGLSSGEQSKLKMPVVISSIFLFNIPKV